MADGSRTPGRNRSRGSVRDKPGDASEQETRTVASKPASVEPAPARPRAVASTAPRLGADGPPRPPANLLELRPGGAFRPPDYRWQLARRLADGEFIPSEWVDSWVLLAEEVLTTPPGPVWNSPDLRAAGAARELAEREPCWQRVEVEARLLAGESVEVIAAKAGLTTAAVEAFAALFFAVADRIEYSGYVLHVVIRLYAPGSESDLGVQARLLGYTGGPHVLDAVLDSVDRPGVRPDEDVSSEDRELRELTRLALGLRMAPVTAENAVTWARLYFLMQECRVLGVK